MITIAIAQRGFSAGHGVAHTQIQGRIKVTDKMYIHLS